GGIGSDQRIMSLAQDPEWMDELRSRRLQALGLDRINYSLILTFYDGGELLLISTLPESSLLDFRNSVDFAYDIFAHLVADPHEAMTVVDAKGKLVFLSPVHEQFFGISRGSATGRHVKEVIENTRLDHVLKTGKAEIAEVQKMRGLERIVSRIPIRRGGEVVGAIGRGMFKGP